MSRLLFFAAIKLLYLSNQKLYSDYRKDDAPSDVRPFAKPGFSKKTLTECTREISQNTKDQPAQYKKNSPQNNQLQSFISIRIIDELR